MLTCLKGLHQEEEVNKLNARKEQLTQEIIEGLEYVLETIGSPERVTLPIIKYKSGNVYGGEWKNGMRDGKGKFEQPDGTVYIGDWKDDAQTGWGKFQVNGTTYEGEWKNDYENGKGTYVDEDDKVKYAGEWENDKQNGKGSEIWENGQRYEGEYSNGEKHGNFIIDFSDGIKYEGSLQQGDLNGYGTYFLTNEHVYTGELINNEMNGKGWMKWEDGIKNTGFYENQYSHGKSVYEWPNGKKFIGTMIQGNSRRIGIIIFTDIKIGIWKVGENIQWIQDYYKFEEQQLLEKPSEVIQYLQQRLFDLTLSKENQVQIRCDEKNNQRVKLPPIKLCSKAIYEGEWRNAMKDGQGKILFSDGSFYEGQWVNNLKQGWGKQISKDEKVFEGEWLEDQPCQVNEKQTNIEIKKSESIDIV